MGYPKIVKKFNGSKSIESSPIDWLLWIKMKATKEFILKLKKKLKM